jgi:exodeoxyribonuclease VII large subunit
MASTMTEQPQDLRTIKATNEFLRSIVETKEVVRDKFWMGGVVSSFYKSDLGHIYFTLEDEGFAIDCMFSNRLADKAVYITNGVVIDVYGSVRMYEKKAQLQLRVEDLRLAKPNQATFNPQVLEQLKAQGIWPRAKRELPQPPRHIALITSKNSEALSDFRETYNRENGKAYIQLMDTPIQTEDAPLRIAERIVEANEAKKADVIVIIRGGGRNVELATFNDIQIAEAICRSGLPVVTGIGHQRDETIADRVADESTITPTDAAYRLAKLEPQKIKPAKEPQSSFIQTNAMGIIGIIVGILVLAALIFQSL